MNRTDSRSQSWLITGGLGYIGAHIAMEFISAGHKVYIIDNLSTGILERKPENAIFIPGDVRDSKLIKKICNEYGISGIVHLAAFKHARESRLNPSKYWHNNVGATLGLIEGIQGTKVSKVLFSSSCSIYGNNPDVNEDSPDNPQSPYAFTKKTSEEMLSQVLPSTGVSYTALRFFNVIGCASYPLAHDSSDECLVPVITNQIFSGAPFKIFGDSHPTLDGTCMRDYLDVRDLAKAHTLVASRLESEPVPLVINVSAGIATSVLQVLSEFESVIGKKINFSFGPANPADPIAVWCRNSRILEGWGWRPEFNLKESISSHLESLDRRPS